ncbi:MAG: dTDP-glucose pyrophosphorylase [Bacteroidales bacterium]|nr:dTDP-glucose pyrophosphorylase [Bacteroidales bacterium]
MESIFEIVGLIPAAGKAERLGLIPMSKELYPIEFSKEGNIKVTTTYLLESFRLAGIKKCHMVIRSGKMDIPSYYKSGGSFGLNIAYHITEDERGVPYTIYQAYPYLQDKIVAFGFPDILFKPDSAFSQLINKIIVESEADIFLGAFPVEEPGKWDMVDLQDNNIVNDIVIKDQKAVKLKYAWINCVWRSTFTDYFGKFMNLKLKESDQHSKSSELFIGDVVKAAITDGLLVKALKFDSGKCIDIGTFEGLNQAHEFIGQH